MEKICHVKSEMHIRPPSGVVTQDVRKMNLEFRVYSSFRKRAMGDITYIDCAAVMGMKNFTGEWTRSMAGPKHRVTNM